MALHTGKSLSECADLCSADPACLGFEYGVDYGGGTYSPGDCQLSSSNNISGCNGAALNLDFYNKTDEAQPKSRFEWRSDGDPTSSSDAPNCSSSSTWADANGAACSDYHINAAAVRNTFDCAFSGKVMKSCNRLHCLPCSNDGTDRSLAQIT